MNAIVPLQKQSATSQENRVTMLSLEIVDFINEHRKASGDNTVLRHSDFMVKVPKVLGLETSEKFRSSYLAGNNENRPCYTFPKREACLMAMSYSYELQAKVFDRMTAMEDALKNQTPDPMQLLADPNLLRNALLTYSEKVIGLEHKVEVMQPTVDAFDRIAKAEGSLCLRDAANNLQMRQSDLIKWLQANNWIYKRNGNAAWHGYSDKLQAGYLEHKTDVITRSDGSEKITEQVRVTPKGLTKLSKLLGNNNV